MTPRNLVEAALRGERVPRVPFTVYENMIPQCVAEREMRNRGLCLLKWDVQPVITRRPNVKVKTESWREGERKLIRTHYDTPAGSVSTLEEDAGYTTWYHETMFKDPGDYKVLKFIAGDAVYTENYAAFREAGALFGEDGIYRPGMGDDPMQAIMIPPLMNMETFAGEWVENRDEILSLYGILRDGWRRLIPFVAGAPGLAVNCNGNFVVDMLGPKGFEEYFLPLYQEAAETMHRGGKLLGSHLDGNCRAIAPLVARSGLDYIEAFTPAPDTDMSLADARTAWPGKAIWLNFPSSLHLKSDADVEKAAFNLLDEAGRPEGIIMGVTEDMPPHRWRDSCRAIMCGLERHAGERPALYSADR